MRTVNTVKPPADPKLGYCPDCGSPDYMKVPVFAGGGGQIVDEVLECQQCYDREVYGEVRT